MNNTQHQAKKTSGKKFQRSIFKRTHSWFGAVFVIVFLIIAWFLWGQPYFGSSLRLVVDPNIDQNDGRVDYDVLRSAADAVGEHLMLREPLTLHVRSCEDANAYYDVDSQEIILCDQLIDDFVAIFKTVYNNPVDVTDASTNALVFIAFHELGHAIIDVLDIPITGKEEDVADQLSAYILINSFEDGAQYVLDGATWFGVTSEQYNIDETDFADEHSLDAQRYYTLACWVYGANSDRFGQVVLEGGLSRERADGCKDEYERFSRSWDVLLEDHFR